MSAGFSPEIRAHAELKRLYFDAMVNAFSASRRVHPVGGDFCTGGGILDHSRGLAGYMLSLLFGAGVLTALLINSGAPAAGLPGQTISVIAGDPSELTFTLSKFQAPLGTVVFKVRNAGRLAHNFKVCTAPSRTEDANVCAGKVTTMLKPGQSAILSVIFKRKGTYEYLCTVTGHAAAGMKGQIGLGQTAPKPAPSPKPTTPVTTSPVTPPPATEALIGDPTAGAPLFNPNCGSCHTLAAAGAKGVVGPSLDVTAPGQQLIVTQVTNGGQGMPSFGGSLSSTQINNLAAYIYQSTHR